MDYDKDYEYASTRLSGTYIWHTKLEEYVLFSNIGSNGIDFRRSSSRGERQTSPMADFSFTPKHFGLINAGENAVHPTRIPIRRDWKQGIRSSQFHFNFTPAEWSGRGPRADGDLFGHHLAALNKAARGEYPDILDALERLEEHGNSVAISPRISVSNNFLVFYNSLYEVGSVNPDNGTIELKEAWALEQARLASRGKVSVSIKG